MRPKGPSLLSILAVFARIGGLSLGGPPTMIMLFHQILVEGRRWIDERILANALAIGQILPGPIVVDAATHIGYKLRGILGAVASTAGLLLPPFLIVLLISPLYFGLSGNPLLEGAFKGIGGAVVGLLVAASLRIGRRTIRGASGLVAALLAFLALVTRKIDPILTLLVLGLAGAVLKKATAKRKGDGRDGS
ncbi:MAG TPA: chromate transporter [Armatimonadetes bacterium]|nr:chromate transporter [Armatimonadota bacterium]